MKRILFILAIALFSCSADETSTTPQEELNCNCSTILEADVFGLPTGQTFTAGVMANDCTGVQKNFTKQGILRAGEKICN
jgi:hypothetical protein